MFFFDDQIALFVQIFSLVVHQDCVLLVLAKVEIIYSWVVFAENGVAGDARTGFRCAVEL